MMPMSVTDTIETDEHPILFGRVVERACATLLLRPRVASVLSSGHDHDIPSPEEGDRTSVLSSQTPPQHTHTFVRMSEPKAK